MTIYPFNKVEFTKIVRELYPLLKKYNGPYILSDKRYLDSKVIYYRYGIITSKIDNNIMKFPEGELEDKRVPFYIQPKYVNDPLEENTPSNLNDSTENILTTNYKDIEAIHFSNGGGIYKAFNLKKQKNVILKEARPYIGISTDNTSISCRKREAAIFEKIEYLKLTPKLNSKFYEWEHYFIEVEKIEGSTISEFTQKHTLVMEKETDHLVNKKKIQVFLLFTRNLLVALKKIQSVGLVINDISENNILITADFRPIFIDLEDAYFLDENVSVRFDIANQYFEDNKKEKLLDFKKDTHKLGYLLMSMLSNSNSLLKKDTSGEQALSSFLYFCKLYRIDPNLFQMIKLMISGNYNNIDELSELIERIEYPYKYNLDEFEDISINKPIVFNEGKIVSIDSFGLSLLIYCDNYIDKKILNIELSILEKLFEEDNLIEINRIISSKEFVGPSLDGGRLEEIYIYIYLLVKTNDIKYLTMIKEKIKCFSDTYLGKFNLVEDENKNAIPYIYHSAGFAKAIMKYLMYDFDNSLFLMLEKVLDAIDRNFPKEFCYSNGLSGIADTLLEAYKVTKQTKYLISTNKKKNLIVNLSKEKSNSFSFGTEGINYFLYKYNKYIKGELCHEKNISKN